MISHQTSCGPNYWGSRCSRVRITIQIRRCGTWVPSARDSTADPGTSLTSGCRSRTPKWASARDPHSSLGGTTASKRLLKGSTPPWPTTSSRGYRTAEECSYPTARRTPSHCSSPPLLRAIGATTAAASPKISHRCSPSTCHRANTLSTTTSYRWVLGARALFSTALWQYWPPTTRQSFSEGISSGLMVRPEMRKSGWL